MNIDKAIAVWRFDDAPKAFQALSKHGGDEDWLALVPAAVVGDPSGFYLPWAETGTPFGCCEVSQHVLPSGSVVLIGAHS